MGLACLETALGPCFYFSFRVVEIMETIETNSETCFSYRIYAGLTWNRAGIVEGHV